MELLMNNRLVQAIFLNLHLKRLFYYNIINFGLLALFLFFLKYKYMELQLK